MVTVPKEDQKLPENNTVIMSSQQIKPEDVVIEHAAEEFAGGEAAIRKPKDDPIAELRRNQESAERALEIEREKRLSAERERDAARTQVDVTRTTLAKSESEKIVAQEVAITSRIDEARADVENIERAYEEAIDTGKPAKEQVALQKKLAQAVYKLEGAERTKQQFDTWKEKEKNKPVPKPANDGMTPEARAWVDSHPRYNTDKHYRRAAIAAHEDAIEDGVKVDSAEYFRRINEAVAPLESNKEDAVVQQTAKKSNSGTSTAAPASYDSTGAGAKGRTAAEEQRTGRRTFKLDAQMRDMAIKTYGKNSHHKLSDEEAYKRYAARQLEIRDKRANGENI